MENGICSFCGKEFHGKATKDHFFPMAIYKWNEPVISTRDAMRLKHLLNCRANITRMHLRCNEKKQDAILDPSVLQDKSRTRELFQLRDKLRKPIAQYTQLKEKTLEKQKHLCYWCGCRLLDDGVIRRIDPELDRTADNACIVCKRCNEKHGSFVRE